MGATLEILKIAFLLLEQALRAVKRNAGVRGGKSISNSKTECSVRRCLDDRIKDVDVNEMDAEC